MHAHIYTHTLGTAGVVGEGTGYRITNTTGGTIGEHMGSFPTPTLC